MLTFLGAAALAFGAIFLAEFGDKSQLLVLAFATRYPARPVILGVVLAASIIQGVSVAIGAVVGAALPATAVGVVSGIAFLAVAAWTLRGDDDEHEPDAADAANVRRLAGIALVLAVASTFILSELGDKTMLATFALAATQGALPTWIGSTAGEVGATGGGGGGTAGRAPAVGADGPHRLGRALRRRRRGRPAGGVARLRRATCWRDAHAITDRPGPRRARPGDGRRARARAAADGRPAR
jgi:putative Ca2+/H+ antiporter (TMEM165/GDT1 family)